LCAPVLVHRPLGLLDCLQPLATAGHSAIHPKFDGFLSIVLVRPAAVDLAGMLPMSQSAVAAFLRDPVTVSRKELIEHYRTQSARYKELAGRQNRSWIHEGLVNLARQCAAMADALASPEADQSAKLCEADILILLDEVMAGGKSASRVLAAKPSQLPLVMSVPPHELSLDEILQKVQRDIAEERPAVN